MHGSRRQFLQGTSMAAAGLGLAAPLEALAGRGKTVAPGDKIRFGVIGVRGMGWSNMRSALKIDEVECVGLCDADQRELDRRTGDVIEAQGQPPKQYRDYRRLLDDKNVDAVIIGTPDHWHCLMLVDALNAGKHVYVEKPLANSIEEANVMLAAINAHLGNIAYKVGRKIYWDPDAGAFKGDDEANALLTPGYHNGWELPKV